ncbi:MAG TPA: trypsin-like peptidase domain-containing protein [Gemmatimonadales bacterium]|nr:trypsin-like peptidase domain-containing protein [Gemmatimonadales bacterium]
MSSKSRDLLKLGGIVAVAFVLGLAFASGLNLPRPGRAESARGLHYLTAASGGGARTVDGVLPSFADIAERVRPSVVYIRTQSTVQSSPHPDIPPGFQYFFGPDVNPRRPQVRQGSGSGFVVSQDGYILTNNHVVADAEHVRVTLLDNREFDARVVGRDPATDVAVIKIDAGHLTPLPLGNSDGARIGDWVLAIGNPLNFTFTVTAGIVSAKGRPLYGLQDPNDRYQIQDFIQTDAAINPGNSGGPLVNLNGEVIGINAAIASQTGYYEGYGFAVPINLARKVMDDLIATGRVERAVLCIAINQITPEDAEAVGLKDVRGVVIQDFSCQNSPAKAAGLVPGDVIVALNDTAIDHVAQLQSMVGFRHPGEVVHVQAVHAGGQVRTYDVRLASAGADTAQVASATRGGDKGVAPGDEASRKLGVTVESLSAEDARQVDTDLRGPLVTEVDADGPAFQKLFPPGAGAGADVILEVNGVRTRTPEELQRAAHGLHAGDIVTLRVANVGGGSATRRVVRLRVR